ncbi:MAG: DUF262 domain-containing protein [Collinsella sp.]|nr:DUF262 domain-containing protein [Collinsella sp.]
MHSVQYEIVNIPASDLMRIKLPRFQRKLVWPKSKKDQFINTLHEGLPFGSVLVYPESQEPDADLLIIDGQQRLSTIIEFNSDRLAFWKPLNQDTYLSALASINEALPGELQLSESQFDNLLRRNKLDLDDWLDDIDDKSSRKTVRAQFGTIEKALAEYVDLSSLLIPAIKFIGDKSLIAEVFSRLNQGGIKLSKYQVFSAAWIHTQIKLSTSGLQSAILDNVKKHYTSMGEGAAFELDGFSEDLLSATRIITLSDLATALGMFLQEHLKALAPQTDNKISELGYGLLGVAVDLDNRKLGHLVDYSDYIQANLQHILEKTDRICSNLQDVFSKMLKVVKANKNDEYARALSTNFKTLSYFAALWYLDPESEDYRSTLKNIKAHYLLDALTGVWSSAGDQRLLEYQPSSKKRDYLTPVSSSDLEAAFDQWLASSVAGIRFSSETKAIITIHANLTYLATTVPNGESFELEHIIAKKFIEAASDTTKKGLFGNSIGNCMFLPKGINNRKKAKTLYEVNTDGRYNKLIQESFYFSEQDLRAALDALSSGDRELVNEIIRARSNLIVSSTVKVLLT